MREIGESLWRRMALGAAWTIAMRVTIRLMGLVSMVILARLLTPEDFGIVALATTLAGLLEVISNFSFDVALIRDQKADRRHYDTAWTLSIIRGSVVASLLVLAAAPAAVFFGDSRVETVVYFLAVAALIDSLQNIGVVDFRKNLEFHKDFFLITTEKLGAVTVGIALAVLWRDYWALVSGLIAGKAVRLALSYLMHGYRPRFSLQTWQEIFHFTKWLLANNLLVYLYHRSDQLIIGKLLGAQSLGIYAIAHELSNIATTELIAPIRRALLPGYSRIAADISLLQEGFLRTLCLVALLGFPMAVGIGLTAELFVPVLLGQKWLDAIPLIRILAVYGLMQTSTTACGPIYIALNRPKILVILSLTGTLLLIPILLLSVKHYGLYGAAFAVTLVITVTAFLDIVIVLRFLNLHIFRLFSAIWRSGTAVVIMALSVLALKSMFPEQNGKLTLLVYLFGCVGVGASTYVGTIVGLWTLSGRPNGAEQLVLHQLKSLRRSIPRY